MGYNEGVLKHYVPGIGMYKNSGFGGYFGRKDILLPNTLEENGREEMMKTFAGAVVVNYFLNSFLCSCPCWLGNDSP